MKHIISIAFGQEDTNFDELIEYKDQEFRITQYSTNFDLKLTAELIKKNNGKCDCFALSGLPPAIKTAKGYFLHPDVQKIKSLAYETPIADGILLKQTYIPYALRNFLLKHPQYLKGKTVSFYAGLFERHLVDTFSDLDVDVLMADPYTFFHIPKLLNSQKSLDDFAKKITPLMKRMKPAKGSVSRYTSPILKNLYSDFFKAEIFCANESMLNMIDVAHLKDKFVIVDVLSEKLRDRLKAVNVRETMEMLPRISQSDRLNFSIVEAVYQSLKGDLVPLTTEDLMTRIEEDKKECILVKYQSREASKYPRKFAFIIHPLSTSYILKHPILRPFKSQLKRFAPLIEDAISFSPGIFYGNISGIKSEANGQEVSGLIYSVTETPKKLLSSDPEKIYKKLVDLCVKAKDAGAGIIGLGAYTKIVGDAGVSVERMSPIPVTTGNSLSACSTLWAAKFALDKIGIVKSKKNRYYAKVMVVGATGSIGAVSAKILAQSFDELILVAPRGHKLLELKDEILDITTNCKITITTDPDKYSDSCDLIVTTTSAQGKKVIDIANVKPGCVICDVSRPFDISEEDAISRPDVMVIASGEVQLPGDVEMNIDLGLEGNIVYACLAETALLCMEGRLESFTLSRNISYQNVLEIDRLAKKHGVKLASIVGHNGFITDEEFRLCRELALKKLSIKDD